MTLVPHCGFGVHLPDGEVRAGQRLNGTVVLKVEEPISRAENLELAFITTAWASYGSPDGSGVRRATLFHAPFMLGLSGTLGAGEHAHPFVVDIPPWLPPAYSGSHCGIENTIKVRLDVDWAHDPRASFTPRVVVPRGHVAATPVVMRSHPSFHEKVVVEVSLKSTNVVQDGFIEGSIALRGAESARFDAVDLAIVGSSTIRMSRSDRRPCHVSRVRIGAERVKGGNNVPFALRIPADFPPTFKNGFIDHDVVLAVTLDTAVGFDPSFTIPIHLWTAGSIVEGTSSAAVVGSDRSRIIAHAMARAIGFEEGAHPVLIEGTVGPTKARIVDSPRGPRPCVDIDIDFPSVDLGIELRPERLVDLGTSSLLPKALASRFVLLHKPEPDVPLVEDAAIASFVERVTRGLEHAWDIRLTDHHLGFSLLVNDDSHDSFVRLAHFVVARAHEVAGAIQDSVGGLPFPAAIASSRDSWVALAAAYQATLIPIRPSIAGIMLSARLLGGDERSLRATLTSVWKENVPAGVEWSVDLRATPLPEKLADEIKKSEGLPDAASSLKAYFSEVEVHGPEAVTLRASGWHDEPRAWLPGLEAFFAWLLEARSERRADSPYR
ncbi:MAG: hypothetical protein HOV80_25660 [Polyangiaceae bacterium]|nr:hypothetical protein [Polyangiaceae bacterium]